MTAEPQAASSAPRCQSCDQPWKLPEEGPFVGKTIAFTGALSMTRAEASQRVVNAGGTAASAPSKKVDFLVAGIQDSRLVKDGVHSGKMLRAAELHAAGVPIEVLSESDFYRMLQD